ncbi:MAG TPA: DUF2600 family protein [Baekduia sp.]
MSALFKSRDPAPLTVTGVSALAASASRELVWGLALVRAEVSRWRAQAAEIPDPDLRAEALAALADKRPLLDGAALFWILPRRRQPELARQLVALQILANYHDRAGERAALLGSEEPAGAMRALGQAMDPSAALPATYGPTDGSVGAYLSALAIVCRRASAALPSRTVLSHLLREVRRARSMDIEHARDGASRVAGLQQFAASEFGVRDDIRWWELTAGASSLLTAIAAIAVAADSSSTEHDVEAAIDAYIWVGAVGTLLDHYIDFAADGVSGAHNYLNYYATQELAHLRLRYLIDRALREVGRLRRGERHQVIVASMVAMYLTSRSAQGVALRETSHTLIAAGGSLTRLLVPMLRGWRSIYREDDA